MSGEELKGGAPDRGEEWQILTEGAEQMADPAERMRLNPAEFPIFSRQGEERIEEVDSQEITGVKEKQLHTEFMNIDRTASEFVTSTAALIARIDGSARSGEPRADEVIYLDKSARPVSWLVDEFWDDFSAVERPSEDFLLIDRVQWFRRSGVPNVDDDGCIEEFDDRGNKRVRVLQYADFKKENITQEQLAGIRALFIPGGVQTEDPAEIMATPTGLDGKNILIVDEVKRSGSTMKIAEWLVAQAIPEAAGVDSFIFWRPQRVDKGAGVLEPTSSPVWYNAEDDAGRGVGDVNERYFAELYEREPSGENLAKKLGAMVLGEPRRLEDDPAALELSREIHHLKEEYEAGHVLLQMPDNYDARRKREVAERQGLKVGRDVDHDDPESYLRVVSEVNGREAEPQVWP